MKNTRLQSLICTIYILPSTTHFSDYAVIYYTSEKNETDKTLKEEEKKDDGIGFESEHFFILLYLGICPIFVPFGLL